MSGCENWAGLETLLARLGDGSHVGGAGGVRRWHVGLITQREQVQFLPPLFGLMRTVGGDSGAPVGS